jgi:hypothetical protein
MHLCVHGAWPSQLSRPPPCRTPPTRLRAAPGPAVLGAPGATALLTDPPYPTPAWEATPCAPRVQRPRAAAPAPPGGGEAKGVVQEPEKPEPQSASPAQGWAARSESS